MKILGDCTPDYDNIYRLDDDRDLLLLKDGWYAFRHTCDRGKRGVIICAPELTRGGHTVTHGDNGLPTVTPSILCPDCNTHGYITDGTWRSV